MIFKDFKCHSNKVRAIQRLGMTFKYYLCYLNMVRVIQDAWYHSKMTHAIQRQCIAFKGEWCKSYSCHSTTIGVSCTDTSIYIPCLLLSNVCVHFWGLSVHTPLKKRSVDSSSRRTIGNLDNSIKMGYYRWFNQKKIVEPGSEIEQSCWSPLR